MKPVVNFRSIPIEQLRRHVGEKIRVVLKYDGLSYTGVLKNIDIYMNIQLADATESTENEQVEVGSVLIRGNNIFYAQLSEEFFGE